MNDWLAAGYPYELAGFLYYVFFLMMNRKRYAAVYTKRSRLLVVIAAIVMVGSVPFHYAGTFLGVAAMFALAISALISTIADTLKNRRA